MRVLSIKVPIRNKCGNLFNDPCIYTLKNIGSAEVNIITKNISDF